MIYRRRIYKVAPEKVTVFNEFFHTYLLPNQLKNGARLVGRWTNETQDEVTAIWEYESMKAYKRVEEAVRCDPLHQLAQQNRHKLEGCILSKQEDFLHSTGQYEYPKQVITVSAAIVNEKNEVLLVKTKWRNDTWETPGGQVELGETLEEAMHREIFEETGVSVTLQGITGMYHNLSRNILCMMFRAKYKSGEMRKQENEIADLQFVPFTTECIEQLITRPQMRSRVMDVLLQEQCVYEAFTLNPYEVKSKYGVSEAEEWRSYL
jgi:8-oxo-dGTP diphosphatase